MAGWMDEDLKTENLVPLMANSLSMATIMSCLFMKIPQIVNIREKESAEGIYIQALAMEIFGFTIMTLYNYLNSHNPMTYMEYPIILCQVYIMMYLVLKYQGVLDLPIVPLMTALYFATAAGFLLEILPKEILSYLVPLCTPLSGFAKITYIYGIIKTGNADNMSITTWIISVLTNISRVFTVYVDSADAKLLFNFIVSTLLSSGVLATTLYYQTFASRCHVHRRRKSTRRRSRSD